MVLAEIVEIELAHEAPVVAVPKVAGKDIALQILQRGKTVTC